MEKNTFQLDITAAGEVILQNMVKETVKQSAEAIAARAKAMAASQTSKPPDFNVSSKVGVIRRGERAISTISVSGDARDTYIGHMALIKAKDAGKI